MNGLFFEQVKELQLCVRIVAVANVFVLAGFFIINALNRKHPTAFVLATDANFNLIAPETIVGEKTVGDGVNVLGLSSVRVSVSIRQEIVPVGAIHCLSVITVHNHSFPGQAPPDGGAS